jgi:hypothetical protein
MRRAGSGAAITVLHMLLTVVVLFQSTGAALSRFDAGGAASGGDVVFSAVLTLLLLPVALPLFELDVSAGDGRMAYAVLVINSLAWGLGAYLAISIIRARRIAVAGRDTEAGSAS